MTKSIKLEGMYTDAKVFCKMGEVIVRFTSDCIGETLSLCFENKGLIAVPYKQIEKLIENTRNSKDGE